MKAIPHFRAFRDHDLSELEQMIFALYHEDPPGEEISRHKIQRIAQELMAHPEKGAITVKRGSSEPGPPPYAKAGRSLERDVLLGCNPLKIKRITRAGD